LHLPDIFGFRHIENIAALAVSHILNTAPAFQGAGTLPCARQERQLANLFFQRHFRQKRLNLIRVRRQPGSRNQKQLANLYIHAAGRIHFSCDTFRVNPADSC
jgi:hypothetical protein